MYPTPINEIEEIKDQFNGKAFPYVKKVSESLLTMPTHQFLNGNDKEEICKLLNKHGWILAVSLSPDHNISSKLPSRP